MKRTGGRAVVEALEDEGVPFTFGIPGTHNIELYDALAEADRIRPILVTDEQSAGFMADGVWRASGRLGCVNLVPGAGLTHALSGVAEARLDNVPMLVLACGIRRDTGRPYQLHDVDQRAMAEPVTKATFLVERGEHLYRTIRKACEVARSGAPGPVLVEVPAEHYLFRHDVTDHDAPDPGPPAATTGGQDRASAVLSEPRPSVASPRPAPDPDPEALERAARVLAEARRPLLYVGLGAAPAADRLVELAEALEAPVATTFQGKGVFPESHPLWLWPGFGAAAPPFARKVAADCDAVLALGCRFREVGTGSWGLQLPGPMVHVDVDVSVFDRVYPAEVAVEADAERFVDAVLPLLPHRPDPDGEVRARIDEGQREVRAAQLEPAGSGVTPARLLATLQERLGPETVYTTDSGNGTFLALETLRLDRPGRFLAPVDYSCMGYSVPAAVGAKLARPDVPVVALAGDGAFLMTGLELLTAVREEVGLLVVVLRDRELAQISQFQDVAFHRRASSELPDYDLSALARGVGAEALELAEDDAIGDVLSRARELTEEGRTVVVDAAVDYSRKTWFTKGVVRTTLGRLPWSDRLRFVGRALLRRVTE